MLCLMRLNQITLGILILSVGVLFVTFAAYLLMGGHISVLMSRPVWYAVSSEAARSSVPGIYLNSEPPFHYFHQNPQAIGAVMEKKKPSQLQRNSCIML